MSLLHLCFACFLFVASFRTVAYLTVLQSFNFGKEYFFNFSFAAFFLFPTFLEARKRQLFVFAKDFFEITSQATTSKTGFYFKRKSFRSVQLNNTGVYRGVGIFLLQIVS